MITTADLKAQSRRELADLARNYGVPGWHGLKKDELISEIQKVQRRLRRQATAGSAKSKVGTPKANGKVKTAQKLKNSTPLPSPKLSPKPQKSAPPLSRRGVLQARKMARLLPELEIDAIYSSPLRRALETAQILAQGHPVPVETDPDLTEVAFGRWEGLRSGDLLRDRVYRRFVQAPTRTVVPGGETIRGVQRRG